METVKTHCYICNCRCGIQTYSENGRIIKVEGDPACQSNLGALCIKGRAMLEFQYDPDRLGYPLRRQGDEWHRVSWDEALAGVVDRLNSIRDTYGPESVAFFRGMSVYSWLIPTYFKRFVNLYGSPNYFSNAALCIGPKIYSNKFTFGPGLSTCGDFLNSRCILLFGTNPAVTGMHRSLRVMRDILKARKKGAKLIVVDPKRTETAAKADIYTPVRPGTDAALVLSLIHLIIENDWYDHDFVARWVSGFEQLREAVRGYTPARAEEITWVKRAAIREIAEVFARTKPACADRREGIFHHENATQTCRAINALNVITGNIDIPGGIILQKNLFDSSHPRYEELTLNKAFKPKVPSVAARNPVTQDVPTDLLTAILEEKPYPVKALVVLGCNPLLSWPNTSRVLEAMNKLEFILVIDVYRNDTASFADYALPAATFLEKLDLAPPNVALPKVMQLQQPVVAPFEEAKPEMWIIRELARRMGYGAYYSDSEEALIDTILEPWHLTCDILKEHPSGLVFEPCPVGSFRRNGFPTQSGTIEIRSPALGKLGFDPLPVFREPSRGPVAAKNLTIQYPLILVTGQRVRSSYLSFLHNLPSLHKITPHDWVEIHPETAASRRITDGEKVTVTSPQGQITLTAKLISEIDPRVVFIPYGWGHQFNSAWQLANSAGGECVNYLVDDSVTDPISGIPGYKSMLCEVRKITECSAT